MSTSTPEMNRFERILFRVALVLGGLLIGARLAAMVVVWYAHYFR